MVSPSWLTKRDRTGGPDGPRAGLALASGGLSSYDRAHRAAVHGTSARRAAQAKGQGQAGAARFRHLGTGHRPDHRLGRETGKASWRGKVVPVGWIPGVAGKLK